MTGKLSPTHEAPYRGLRVLDFGQGIASPYCAMLLGVYGADVIKVEPPEGDWSRFLGTTYGNHTTLSAVYNRGKRSLCLDMKHKDAHRDRPAAGERLRRPDRRFSPRRRRPARDRLRGTVARQSRPDLSLGQRVRAERTLLKAARLGFGCAGLFRPGVGQCRQRQDPAPGRHHRLRRRDRRLRLPGDRHHAVRARDRRHRPLDRRQSLPIDGGAARPQGRRACSGRRRAAGAQRAGRLLSDQRWLDDGDAGQRAAIQAPVRRHRARRPRQRSALCRFCQPGRLGRHADLAAARGFPDAADARPGFRGCMRPISSPSESSIPANGCAIAHVEATKAAVCQDTPGVGPVYTPRTPGIASLSEDALCPAPDIGQDSVAILTEAGLDRGAIDDLIKAGAVRQAKQ